MDYLPSDPHEKEKIKISKKENDLKDFRSYVVDKDIVKSIVKVLLKLRYQETKPRNPMAFIREFFQTYRDPFNAAFQMQNDIDNMKEENPKLERKIEKLEKDLIIQKIKFRVKRLYQMYDLDAKTGMLSTKLIFDKLAGLKKFEVDEKISLQDFYKFLNSINDTDISHIIEIFENSTKGETPFKDDLNNPLFKKLVDKIKEMQQLLKPVGKK